MHVHFARPVAGLAAIQSQTFRDLFDAYEGTLWAAPSRAATSAWSPLHPTGRRWTGVHTSGLTVACPRVAPEVCAHGRW